LAGFAIGVLAVSARKMKIAGIPSSFSKKAAARLAGGGFSGREAAV
jgi:hypothetical protein